MINRAIECDVCGAVQSEGEHGGGFEGWGALHGIQLNNVPNPCLCPDCLGHVANYADHLASTKRTD